MDDSECKEWLKKVDSECKGLFKMVDSECKGLFKMADSARDCLRCECKELNELIGWLAQ